MTDAGGPPAGGYPCPVCGAPADLRAGCGGCGRPPDAAAAEVVRLGADVASAEARVFAAWRGYRDALAARDRVAHRREALAAQVRARTAAERAAAPPRGVAAPPGVPPRGVRPETSPRTAEVVLFAVSGLLLASAAVVFTATSWASYGVTARALILAAVTLAALAVPPLARWRRLPGTAETFAALGVLLVPLDGYAAWYVDLGGVTGALPASTYAGLVAAGTAVLAAGYHRWLRLLAPALVALAAAQPVLPLLVAHRGPGPAGWALVLGAVAGFDLAVSYRVRPVLAVPAGALAGLAGGSALFAAMAAVGLARRLPDTARAAAALVAVVALAVPAAWRLRVPALRQVAAGLLAAAVALGAGRTVRVAWPGLSGVLVPAVLLGVAALAVAVPAGYRPGARTGAAVAVAVGALVPLPALLSAVGATLDPAWPAWTGHPNAVAPPPDGWQLPLGLVLLAAAVVLVWSRRHLADVAAVLAAVLAVALPYAYPAPWWAPSVVDAVVAGALGAAALYAGTGRSAVLRGGVALALAGYAVLAGLVDPAADAWALVVLLAAGLAVAAPARAVLPGPGAPAPPGPAAPPGVPGNPAAPPGVPGGQAVPRGPGMPPASGPVLRRRVGAVAAAVAVVTAPALATCVAALAGTGAPGWRYAAVGGLAAAAVPVAVSRWRWPAYPLPALAALLAAGLGVAMSAPLREAWAGPLAGMVLVVGCAAAVAVWWPAGGGPGAGRWPPRPAPRRWPAAWFVLVGLRAAVVAVPGVVWVLAAPYTWLGEPWAGRPAAPGVSTGDAFRHGPWGTAAATLGLLALAAPLPRLLRAARAAGASGPVRPPAVPVDEALPLAAVAGLVALAAAGAPWPAVPALTLLVGLAATLVTQRARRGLPAGAVLAVAATGAGLAGLLPTRASTLAALAAVLVVNAVTGVAGVRTGGRVAGWLVAAGAAGSLAATAALGAGSPVRIAGLCVLAAAAAVLAAGVAVARTGRRAETLALEVAAHSLAVVALLLAVGDSRYAAIVLFGWAVALGLRALPEATRAPRVAAGIACALAGYWVLLAGARVGPVEAYTLPAAAVGVGAGVLVARARPGLRSWYAYGPALLVGFAPSLAALAIVEGQPWRRLLLGSAALAVLLLGVRYRLRAPVDTGAGVLVLLALNEATLWWDRLPRWIPLAAAGLVLVALAANYERTRRNLALGRAALRRMR